MDKLKSVPIVRDGVTIGFRIYSDDGIFGTWRFQGYEWV